MNHLSWVFPSTEESQATDGGAEEESNNSCEKEGVGTKGEEERSISAPLVLSQERREEVCRRLRSLEEQLKRLKVRGGELRESERDENIELSTKQVVWQGQIKMRDITKGGSRLERDTQLDI